MLLCHLPIPKWLCIGGRLNWDGPPPSVAFSSLRQPTSQVAANYGCTVDGMAGDDVEEETDGSHVALLRLQPKSKAGYSYSGRANRFPLFILG